MKTLNFGTAPFRAIHICFPGDQPSLKGAALKNYRENRENGADQDSPKTPFPSAGFDALDIKSRDWKSSNDWSDKQGRYWWKLTLYDGRVVEDFYWTEDNVRGWPDKSNKDRYWFIVHHKNGTKIEGFSHEPDYQKGFPDSSGDYWYTFRFTDTHCPAIRQWMEEKDRNYLARLEREKKATTPVAPPQRSEYSYPSPSLSQPSVSQNTFDTQPELVQNRPYHTTPNEYKPNADLRKESVAKSEGSGSSSRRSQRKKTTPMKAVTSENSKALKRLAEDKDTNWREVDKKGNNVFHVAAKQANARFLLQLLKAVPSKLQRKLLTALNDKDDTPLHIAAREGDVKVMNVLFKALDKDVTTCLEKVNVKGHTVLHEAVIAGHLDGVQALIKSGANPDALTDDGKTVQHLAEANGHVMLSQLLKSVASHHDSPPPSTPSFRLPREERDEAVSNERQATFSSASSSSSGSFHRGESSSGSSRAHLKTPAQEHAGESEGSTPVPMGIDEQGVGRVNLVIPNKVVTKGRLIRKGGYGAVYEGKRYGESVAIKELLEQHLTQELKDAFFKEAGIMMRLHHGNIVQLYGILLNPYSMVMEYMQGGALDGLLRSEAPLSWQVCYTISCDVAQGLAFLHHQRIVHRDLKSLNVLLDEHYKAKLSDFGLSKIKNSSSQNYGRVAGTTQWIAPELLEDETREFTKACDVYSYGMLLWEMVSRDIPYKNVENRALVPLYVMRGKRETLPADAPALLSTLITRCWAQDANARPRIEEVTQTLRENPITDNVARPSPHARAKTGTSASLSGDGYLPSHQSSGGVCSVHSHESDLATPTGSTHHAGNANSPLYAKALYAFQAKEANQLSFEKGAMLKVLKRTTDKWWVCEYAGRQGYAPSNYLVLAKENTSVSEGQQTGYARSQFHHPATHSEPDSASEAGKAADAPCVLQSGLGSGYA